MNDDNPLGRITTMKGDTPLYKDIFGEGKGNLKYVNNGKSVKTKITAIYATDRVTGKRYLYNPKDSFAEFKKAHSKAGHFITYTLSHQDDKENWIVLGRTDVETYERSIISSDSQSRD